MEDGIEGASIRRVAAEAGWSTGSLRHYFSTHDELLEFAMRLVVERVEKRLESKSEEGHARLRAERVLFEVLPLDDERRAEMQIWLAFAMRAQTDVTFRPLRDQAHNGLRDLCEQIVEGLGSSCSASEAERLHAFVDGLAMHAVLAPENTTPDRVASLIRGYLDRLQA